VPEDFKCAVFLSHGEKVKAVVCELATRLKRDAVRVSLDEEQAKPGDSILARMEPGTFRFCDSLSEERRLRFRLPAQFQST
jgi:hypothetical protein